MTCHFSNMSIQRWTHTNQAHSRRVTVTLNNDTEQVTIHYGDWYQCEMLVHPELFDYYMAEDETGKDDLLFTATLLSSSSHNWKLEMWNASTGYLLNVRVLFNYELYNISMKPGNKRKAMFYHCANRHERDPGSEWLFEA